MSNENWEKIWKTGRLTTKKPKKKIQLRETHKKLGKQIKYMEFSAFSIRMKLKWKSFFHIQKWSLILVLRSGSYLINFLQVWKYNDIQWMQMHVHRKKTRLTAVQPICRYVDGIYLIRKLMHSLSFISSAKFDLTFSNSLCAHFIW